MKKIKLLRISKHGDHDGFILSKQQEIFEMGRQMLKALGTQECIWMNFGRENACIDENAKEDKVKDYIDTRQVFSGENWWLEFVFGKGKVFLTLHGSKPLRDKLAKVMLKFAKMNEPIKKSRKKK